MVGALLARVAVGTVITSDIDLTADDRFDTDFSGRQVELDGAIHHSVVGDSQAVHPQFFGPRHKVGNTTHAIKQAVLGVDMEVSKHGTSSRGYSLLL